MTTKFIGVKEFRQSMAKISKQAYTKNERLIVLRKNKPIFELRPVDDKEFLLEKFVLDIKKSQADIIAGRVYSQEKVSKMFGL